MNSRQPQFAIVRKPLPQHSVVNHDVSSEHSPVELNLLEPNLAEPNRSGQLQTEPILVVPEESTTSEEVSDTREGRSREHQATVQTQNVEERRDTSATQRSSWCGLRPRKEWPTEPELLPKFLGRIEVAGTEIFLVSVASGFLGGHNLNSKHSIWVVVTVLITDATVLGSFIIALNGKEQSQFGDGIVQTTSVIPSIWPLFFSAGIGGMVKVIAHRMLQSGSSIGVRYDQTC
jgi:hypothetical protein